MESSRASGLWHGLSGPCLSRRHFPWQKAGIWFLCNGDVDRFIGRGREGPSGPWFSAVGLLRWGYYLTLLRRVFD